LTNSATAGHGVEHSGDAIAIRRSRSTSKLTTSHYHVASTKPFLGIVDGPRLIEKRIACPTTRDCSSRPKSHSDGIDLLRASALDFGEAPDGVVATSAEIVFAAAPEPSDTKVVKPAVGALQQVARNSRAGGFMRRCGEHGPAARRA
jgi:hypothetical protein